MIGYLIGGTTVGFFSFKAFKQRQEKKKTDAINEQINDYILSPKEWSESEDVYSLQQQLYTKQLQEYKNEEEIPQKKYFEKTRTMISKKFQQFKDNQQRIMSRFYNYNEKQANDEQTEIQMNQINHINNNLIEETLKTGPFMNIYQNFIKNSIRKNEEKYQQQFKKSITQQNVCKKEGSPQKNKNTTSQQQSGISLQDANNDQLLSDSLFKQLDGQNMNLQVQQKRFYIPINNMQNNFNESTIRKKSIVYQEYKGDSPSNALKQFLNKCEKHLPINNAMIIHYHYGKGDPTSYVLAVEYNPLESQGLQNKYQGIEGTNIGVLKKTDAFKFDFDFKQNNSGKHQDQVEMNKWIESQNNQKLLKQVLEQEIESKIQKSGVRQMKYVEVFSLDDNQNIIKYQVQVPFGQNESAYDLRSKSQTSEVQYHDTFRQFDMCQDNN